MQYKMLTVYYVDILKKKQRHQVVTSQITAHFTLPSPLELASQLQWPANPKPQNKTYPNLDSSSYSSSLVYDGASLEICWCKMATSWQQDPGNMYVLVYKLKPFD